MLDLYPLTQTTEGTFYRNELEFQQAVDEVYRQLGIIYNGSNLPARFGEQYSDNSQIILTGGGNNFDEQISEHFIATNNGHINSMWENCYKAIYICNNIIYNFENTDVEIESSKVDQMKGQVILIRSLVYFNMVRAWGDLPYVEKKISYREAYEYNREKEDVIYSKIIDDLKYSKQVLPEIWTGSDIGRITKYGAAAILAKVYLTIGDKEKAKSELEFIINSNRYSLDANDDGVVNYDDFKYIFEPETKNCKSSVLEVQYMQGENAFNSNHQISVTPFHWAFHLPGHNDTFRGLGQITPTSDLANEFEENDPRIEISINPGYEDLESGVFVKYPYTMKFYDPNWEYPGQNFEIIRYADILLMYSEVTNDPQYLNMVRARVGLPAFASEDYPMDKYPTLTLAIEHERRIELCFEFHRFFDLKRTNRAVEVMTEKGYDFNENKLLFPIPLNFIDVNPEISQNPGYN